MCPHCGVINNAYATRRRGVYRRAEAKCLKDFTVTTRPSWSAAKSSCTSGCRLLSHDFFEEGRLGSPASSHASHQTYCSAWFMAQRIREAMRAGGGQSGAPLVANDRVTLAWGHRHLRK
jgi:hypothetical protein